MKGQIKGAKSSNWPTTFSLVVGKFLAYAFTKQYEVWMQKRVQRLPMA
jgi:hypothetical protein